MFFQLLLYDFITNLTFKKLVKYILCLLALLYYTAYHAIERGHPGLHKAQFTEISNTYAALFRPYEAPLLSVCIAILVLFFCYITYCYRRNKKEEAQLDTADIPPIQELAKEDGSYKSQELIFLKEQMQLIQRRIEAIERGIR